MIEFEFDRRLLKRLLNKVLAGAGIMELTKHGELRHNNGYGWESCPVTAACEVLTDISFQPFLGNLAARAMFPEDDELEIGKVADIVMVAADNLHESDDRIPKSLGRAVRRLLIERLA